VSVIGSHQQAVDAGEIRFDALVTADGFNAIDGCDLAVVVEACFALASGP
jgi:hypothetical protein